MHDRSRHALIPILLAALLSACDPAPDEETPRLIGLSVPGASDWVDTPESAAHSYAVLPLNPAAGSLRLTLDAAYPGSLVVTAIDPASGAVTNLPAIRPGQEDPGGAFYRVDRIDAQARPARWSVTIRPPEMFGTLTSYRISIAHKYGNALSAPLLVTLDGARQS